MLCIYFRIARLSHSHEACKAPRNPRILPSRMEGINAHKRDSFRGTWWPTVLVFQGSPLTIGTPTVLAWGKETVQLLEC